MKQANSSSILWATMIAVSSFTSDVAYAFSISMFQEKAAMQKRTFTKTEGVEIELPDFQELFSRIQQVSPLARLAIEGVKSGVGGGFAQVDDTCKYECIRKCIHLIMDLLYFT